MKEYPLGRIGGFRVSAAPSALVGAPVLWAVLAAGVRAMGVPWGREVPKNSSNRVIGCAEPPQAAAKVGRTNADCVCPAAMAIPSERAQKARRIAAFMMDSTSAKRREAHCP